MQTHFEGLLAVRGGGKCVRVGVVYMVLSVLTGNIGDSTVSANTLLLGACAYIPFLSFKPEISAQTHTICAHMYDATRSIWLQWTFLEEDECYKLSLAIEARSTSTITTTTKPDAAPEEPTPPPPVIICFCTACYGCLYAIMLWGLTPSQDVKIRSLASNFPNTILINIHLRGVFEFLVGLAYCLLIDIYLPPQTTAADILKVLAQQAGYVGHAFEEGFGYGYGYGYEFWYDKEAANAADIGANLKLVIPPSQKSNGTILEPDKLLSQIESNVSICKRDERVGFVERWTWNGVRGYHNFTKHIQAVLELWDRPAVFDVALSLHGKVSAFKG